MSRLRPSAIVLAVILLAPAFMSAASAANWAPDSGDWAGYRRTVDHLGATSATSAFSNSALDLHVKWQRTDDPGYWVPPVAADLDGDGVAEIVATVGNASADPGNPSNPVSVESGLNVVNGATGAMKWQVQPETGYLDFYSPALGDIDNDGQGEIVYFHAQPLTGTSLTNKFVAYEADGTQKWTYSDTNWGSRVPLPLTTVTIGDVDGETTRNEVVMTLLLATVTTTISGGKVVIAGTNPEYRLIALNGEGSSASNAWTPKTFTGDATASNVALGDINADGTLDMVYGSGARSGTLIETDAARITVSADFEDDKIRAYHGGSNPPAAWTYTATGFFPGELGTAPAIVDLDADGTPEVVQPLWVRNFPPGTGETSTVLVLNSDGTEKWRTTVNAAIGALIAQAPPAIADLNGDGKKDLVLQTSNGASGDRYRMIALKHDGSVLWRSPDIGREMTGLPAVGDITGDGQPEVLGMFGTSLTTSQFQTLVVFNGQTGAEKFRKTFDVGTSVGGPLLVDLDGDDDGRLEILVNTGFWGAPGKLIAIEPELPDLRVTALAFSSTEHLHGVPNTISATVTNIGSRTATNAPVRFTESGTTLSDQTVTLASGASTAVQFAWTPQTLGARTIQVEADPGKAMAEWVETNNRQQTTVSVRAPELRLATNDPVFSDGTPGNGDTITVGVTVSNVGGGDASNVLVRFLDGGTTFAEHTIATLADGASVAVSKSLTVSGEDDRTVSVRVDPDGAIVEEDETNNVAARLLNVVAADFTVGSIVFSDNNPGVGDTIEVSATVTNLGQHGASNVLVRFLDEGVSFGEVTIGSLAEGAAATVSRNLLVEGEFDHTIEVVADPDGLIYEESEANNAASRLLDVIFIAADLVLGEVQFSDPAPGEGETIQVSVAVSNTGDKDATAFVVRFLEGATAFAEADLTGLAEGTSTTVTRDLLVTGHEDRTITVVADADLEVNEQDELNNQASRLLDVIFLAPDLVPSGIGLSNPTPGEDETIQVSVTVSNTGTRDAGAFVVRFLEDGVAFGEAPVAGLGQGGATTVSRDLTIVGVAERTITAVVDPDLDVLELDESNNLATRSLRVLVPDLRITSADLAVSDPNPDELDTLTVTATVRNVGEGGKIPVDVLVTLVDDGVVVASATVPSIPAGGSGTATLSYVIGGLGPRSLTVQVDPAGVVRETDDANNEAAVELVVGKLSVGVRMSQSSYPFQTQADGQVTLRFRNTGTPLARHEFIIPVEYVLSSSTGMPTDQLAALVGAALARLAGDSAQHLQLCSLGRCVDATLDLQASLNQLLGGGASGGGQGGELTLRLFTIEARTNALGQASFVVPYSMFSAFDGFEGLAGVEVCLRGFDDLLAQLPQAVPPCAAQVGSAPALPAAANLPGRYRATAVADWHGFIFSGASDWAHV